jgi:hypothetical protein
MSEAKKSKKRIAVRKTGAVRLTLMCRCPYSAFLF